MQSYRVRLDGGATRGCYPVKLCQDDLGLRDCVTAEVLWVDRARRRKGSTSRVVGESGTRREYAAVRAGAEDAAEQGRDKSRNADAGQQHPGPLWHLQGMFAKVVRRMPHSCADSRLLDERF